MKAIWCISLALLHLPKHDFTTDSHFRPLCTAATTKLSDDSYAGLTGLTCSIVVIGHLSKFKLTKRAFPKSLSILIAAMVFTKFRPCSLNQISLPSSLRPFPSYDWLKDFTDKTKRSSTQIMMVCFAQILEPKLQRLKNVRLSLAFDCN